MRTPCEQTATALLLVRKRALTHLSASQQMRSFLGFTLNGSSSLGSSGMTRELRFKGSAWGNHELADLEQGASSRTLLASSSNTGRNTGQGKVIPRHLTAHSEQPTCGMPWASA